MGMGRFMGHHRTRRGLASCALGLLFAAAPLAAQSDLAARCADLATQQATIAYCSLVAQAADILPAKVAIVAAGGNPVPGTASTLGMSLGPLPRLSGAARFTASWVTLPDMQRIGRSEDVDFLFTGLHADGSVGVFQGFSPSATVGGLLALDLLASAGVVRLPSDDGLNGETVLTWGIGARLGITRESFTAPGVSLDVMYRDLGEASFGDAQFEGADAFVHMDETSHWSLRAVAGKRLTALGLTGGVGYDRYSADVLLHVRDGVAAIDVRDDYAAGRWNAFVNGSFTLLVISATAELGWQLGGEGPPDARFDRTGDGGVFASFAIRLAL
jgi:hypothetical protein